MKKIILLILTVCLAIVPASCSQDPPPAEHTPVDSGSEIEIPAPAAPPEESSVAEDEVAPDAPEDLGAEEDTAQLQQPTNPEGSLCVKLFHDDGPWFLIDGEPFPPIIYCFVLEDGIETIYNIYHIDNIHNYTADFPYDLFSFAGQISLKEENKFFENGSPEEHMRIVTMYGDQSGEIQTLLTETRVLNLYRNTPQALLSISQEFAGEPTIYESYDLADGAYDTLLAYLREHGQGFEQDEYYPPVG